MNKALCIAIALASSGVAQADLCDPDIAEGEAFEMTFPSEAHRFSSYRDSVIDDKQIGWVFDPYDRKAVDPDVIAGRKGSLLVNGFQRRTEFLDTDDHVVRYYTAYLSNCEQIYLRVPEEAPWAQNREIPPSYPYDEGVDYLKKQAAEFGVRFQEDTEYLRSLVGEDVVMLPITTNFGFEPWVYRDIRPESTGIRDTHDQVREVTVHRVLEFPFEWRGRQLAPTSLEVSVVGLGRVFVPGYVEHLVPGEVRPVRESYEKRSIEEVLVSRGRPERILRKTWEEMADGVFGVWAYPTEEPGDGRAYWVQDGRVVAETATRHIPGYDR